MIPKTIHQIWIGSKKIPKEWMNTWIEKNLSFKYVLWREKEIKNFGLRFQDKTNYYIKKKKYSIASDIIRIEILERLGGIYIDSDSICIKSIEESSFIKDNFFVGRDYDTKNFINMVANGTIGSIPNHSVLKKYLEKIDKATKYWEFGARMLTECIKDEDITILPTCTFYPVNWKGNKAKIEGEIYANQMWGTTKNLYKE